MRGSTAVIILLLLRVTLKLKKLLKYQVIEKGNIVENDFKSNGSPVVFAEDDETVNVAMGILGGLIIVFPFLVMFLYLSFSTLKDVWNFISRVILG